MVTSAWRVDLVADVLGQQQHHAGLRVDAHLQPVVRPIGQHVAGPRVVAAQQDRLAAGELRGAAARHDAGAAARCGRSRAGWTNVSASVSAGSVVTGR